MEKKNMITLSLGAEYVSLLAEMRRREGKTATQIIRELIREKGIATGMVRDSQPDARIVELPSPVTRQPRNVD